MTNYIYIDLETTANGGPKGESPEAQWPDNRVLLYGWAVNGGPVHTSEDPHLLALSLRDCCSKNNPTIVAHNAKFDIKWLMREIPSIRWEEFSVWDTMTWEYRDSGHRNSFPSLEGTAKEYGIPFTKTLDLGAILSSGVSMEDIPKADLEVYLADDVQVLRQLHNHQLNTGERYHMDYLLPLCEMELRGLPLHEGKAVALAYRLEKEIDEDLGHLMCYIMTNCEWQDGSAVQFDDFSSDITPKGKCIKPTANRTISLLLTGTPSPMQITQKWKLSLRDSPLLSSQDLDDIYHDNGVSPTHIGYPLDETTMEVIAGRLGGCEVIERVMRHRRNTKIVNTYLLPMLQHYKASANGTVHPKLNTAVTATGRLSSSEPNGQNMPEQVRALIEAEFGYEIEELDFSQLETVGAAVLSGCAQLIHDLQNGVDIHYNTAADVFGHSQASTKRKLAKNVNFGVLYGGKATGLAKQTGVDRATIQRLIDAFYCSYPGVRSWQKDVAEEVKAGAYPYEIKNGAQRYASDWTDPVSGRKFRFVETEAPAWKKIRAGRGWAFSLPQIANYPIQGFAGGDLVMTALEYLWHECKRTGQDVEFLLTVHDSIIIMKGEGIDLTHLYDNMINHVTTVFNLPVTLKYDVETGRTWS